ncbi:DUF1559 domain-containing protein [Thalassoroseus pseudoceratinae]|uniref:DUF1559 domain-containing protein n=1 Tax=Thalassoroseus pseudoceratinae TaxID=2713176 RepID=UPI0014217CED|nr:DUF1559 domain-containing protein [Thalassoroseus pseudoceratinae]
MNSRSKRRGMTLIELLVVLAVIGVLVTLLLPAIQNAREAARRTACRNNLKQIGIGLHLYHDACGTLPSGYVANLDDPSDEKGWGWSVLLLPYLEQTALHDALRPTEHSLTQVVSDPVKLAFLQTPLDLFVCPSDRSNVLAHEFRSIVIPETATTNQTTLTEAIPGRSLEPLVTNVATHVTTTHPWPSCPASIFIFAHLPPPPPPNPDPEPDPKPDPDPVPTPTPNPQPAPTLPAGASFNVAKSNYVGVFGSRWAEQRVDWSEASFAGNGLFGRNSSVKFAHILDGTSNTLAIGERNMRNYAATWPGVDSSQGCTAADNQTVLGTAFYPINDDPSLTNVDCDGTGSANFSSYHPGGSNFLMADGSVRFLSETIDFRRNATSDEMGLFQKLADRSDEGGR